MTEGQTMIGLNGSWLLTNFLVIGLTEFTGLPCAMNTHAHTHLWTQRDENTENVFSEEQMLL